MPGMFSKYEGEDGYDIIEWMSEQPWCNGQIGGTGPCYFGFTSLNIPERQPPHHNCIAPLPNVVRRHPATKRVGH